jgi:hypothetical protein
VLEGMSQKCNKLTPIYRGFQRFNSKLRRHTERLFRQQSAVFSRQQNFEIKIQKGRSSTK